MKITAPTFLFFLLFGYFGFGQQLRPVYDWDKIEKSIRLKDNLRDMQKELSEIKTAAEKQKNDVELARAMYCGMLVNDLLTEDSLYFKNSAFIDSALRAPGSGPALKTMMHLMQARRIQLFLRKSLKFKRSTYETKLLSPSYASLPAPELDSLVAGHLEAAKVLGARLPLIRGELRWLSGNAEVLLFKADLEDIAVVEQIGHALSSGNGNFAMLSPGSEIMEYDERKFLQALDEIALKLKWNNKATGGYRYWLNKHRADPEVYGYIVSLVRSAVYESYRQDSAFYRSYERHLLRGMSSSYPLVRAACAFQLFQMYVENGQKYRSGYHQFNREGFYKAMQLYLKHQSDLVKYTFYEKQVSMLVNKIKAMALSAYLQEKQLPGKPVLLKVDYRNVSRFHYRIIRNNHLSGPVQTAAQLLKKSEDQEIVRADSLGLPSSEDNNSHAVYLKLEPFQLGNYHLIFAADDLGSDSVKAGVVSFSITNLAAVSINDRVITLDRKTGFPVNDVKITPLEDETLRIVKKGDTLLHHFEKPESRLPDDVYSNEEYDDLNEYYDEHTELQVYTDRGIYRPGQKVFFKTILVSKNPKNGDLIIFNKDKGKAFTYWMAENKPILFLKDAQGRKLDSLKIVPDDYGSFSGTFVLPKNALPGDWSIEERYLESFAYSGEFKVEEYKRPSFELVLAKKNEPTLPGEPFEFRLKARSFAGAALAGLKVIYRVSRRPENYGQEVKLTDTMGFTDGQGELLIRISDPLPGFTASPKEKWLRVNYELQATATENTGEQAELKASQLATAWQVDVKVKLKEFYQRSDLSALRVSVESLNKDFGRDSLNVEIYALEKEKIAGSVITDQWKYALSELRKWFTEEQLGLEYTRTRTKKLVFTERVTADQGMVRLNAAKLTSGIYELLVTSGQGEKVRGTFVKEFRVFDDQPGAKEVSEDFVKMPVNSFRRGDTATVYVYFQDSTHLISSFSFFEKRSRGIALGKKIQERIYKGGTLQRIQFVIPGNADDVMVFRYAYVRNGQLFRGVIDLFIEETPKLLPEIIVEKYRKVLAPGAKETFRLSVKTNNKNTAAQLLTTMYDATLDKLAQHTFDLGKSRHRSNHNLLEGSWSYAINNHERSEVYGTDNLFYTDFVEGVLQGKVAPVFVQGFLSNKLDEVVVSYNDGINRVAYGMNINNVVTLKTKELSSLLEFQLQLIVIDGVAYEGKLADFNADLITDGLVIKGEDAVALYGSKAASGVLLLSTKGKIVLPATEPPVAKIRKNFNETAFFLPDLYAGKNGMYSFSFEMPESATTWNWKMMAHTKKGQFAYAGRELYTQLNLMVQPNMPRLLYQGDQLVLQSRINSLDTAALKGRVSCSVEDAVTGADLSEVVLRGLAGSPEQNFSLGAKGNVYVAFKLKVPEDQLNPLKIVISAVAGQQGDAEEHIIPVMSRKIFVKQSQPLRFLAADTLLKQVALPADAIPYGLGVSINLKPQSALLYSLPWLANYSYDCAEQIFNKFYANYTAYNLMKSDPALAKMYMQAAEKRKADTSLKAEVLSDELIQTVTPWLGLQDKQLKEQQQLFKLLDTAGSKVIMKAYLEKLYRQQNSDGGISWFNGGKSSSYISSYLLAGFGKLKDALPSGSSVQSFTEFINKLIVYADRGFLEDQDMYGVFARSFWLAEYPLSPARQSEVRKLLDNYWKTQENSNLYSRVLAVLSGLRIFQADDPLHVKSKAQLESVMQMAIHDPVNGWRWKEIADEEQTDVSAEELIELLSFAFNGTKQESELNEGLLKWILNTKSEQHWTTTKGTSAAINLLTKVKGNAVGASQKFDVRAGANVLTVSDDLLYGVSDRFVKLGQREGTVALGKSNPGLAQGNLIWYYFTGAAHLSALNKSIQLSKQLYLFSESTSKWTPVANNQVFKMGAKVKVVLSIKTAKPLKYVQLDDYRAAAFEAEDKNSGQQHQDGMSFYQAVRDTGLQFFAEFIPSGRSEISYEMRVVNEGIFTGGPAVLSCMYHSELVAYSNEMTVRTEP